MSNDDLAVGTKRTKLSIAEERIEELEGEVARLKRTLASRPLAAPGSPCVECAKLRAELEVARQQLKEQPQPAKRRSAWNRQPDEGMRDE